MSTRGIRLRRDAQPWLLCRTGMLAPELPPCGGPLHSPPISDTARPTLVRTALAPPCGVVNSDNGHVGAFCSTQHRTGKRVEYNYAPQCGPGVAATAGFEDALG